MTEKQANTQITLNFMSDNVATASPAVLEALVAAMQERAAPYGADRYCAALLDRFRALFECSELEMLLTSTGTAANALALSCAAPSFGAIFCADLAHINLDECNAPEFFTNGAKLIAIPSVEGKITPEALKKALIATPKGVIHRAQPAVLSLSQCSELGTVYSLDEIKELSAIAKAHGMAVHMDGARFANALVSVGCSAAQMTWQAGVDILSFGGTKNGCLAAEAVLFFNPQYYQNARFLQKRSGQVLSKMRVIAAQFLAYLDQDLWLENARHANALAGKLAQLFAQHPQCSFVAPVQGNLLFVRMPQDLSNALKAKGLSFYDIDDAQVRAHRFVCAFDQSLADCAPFEQVLGHGSKR